MVIKNKTLFQKEYVEAAMRAGNFDDNKYKFFKIVYNMFGLLFGMGLVRYLVFQAIGSDEADWFMVVFYGCAAAIFLYRYGWNGQKQQAQILQYIFKNGRNNIYI